MLQKDKEHIVKKIAQQEPPFNIKLHLSLIGARIASPLADRRKRELMSRIAKGYSYLISTSQLKKVTPSETKSHSKTLLKDLGLKSLQSAESHGFVIVRWEGDPPISHAEVQFLLSLWKTVLITSPPKTR